MAQWISIIMVALGFTVTACVMWGKFTERMDYMKAEIINLQGESQTPEERELLARSLSQRFEAYEKLYEYRFSNLEKLLDSKFSQLLAVISGSNHRT